MKMQRSRFGSWLLAGAALLALGVGCASEVGRSSLIGLEPQALTVELAGDKEVVFWVDLDIEYSGDPTVAFDIEMEQNGATAVPIRCDALDPSVKRMSVEVTSAGSQTKRYQGKMRCSAQPAQSGPATFLITPIVQPAPTKLERLDLVVKQ